MALLLENVLSVLHVQKAEFRKKRQQKDLVMKQNNETKEEFVQVSQCIGMHLLVFLFWHFSCTRE